MYNTFSKSYQKITKGERHFLPYQMIMNNNKTPNRPPKKQLAPRDMMIVAVVILVFTRIDFANINSFHVLILFLLFLMLMLRWANMRKDAVRKQAMERYKDQYEDEERAAAAARKPAFQWEDAPAESPAEKVSAEDMTIDSEPVPAEEVSEEAEETSAE